MKNILEFINVFGIHVDESTPLVVLLAGYYLILSVWILLNVLNICIYLLSLYILSNERLVSKISSKYVFIHKIFLYYKKTRIGGGRGYIWLKKKNALIEEESVFRFQNKRPSFLVSRSYLFLIIIILFVTCDMNEKGSFVSENKKRFSDFFHWF